MSQLSNMGLLVAPPKRAMDEVVVFLDEDIAITNGSEKVIEEGIQ